MLVSKLLDAINRRDRTVLLREFAISDAVASEIFEDVGSFVAPGDMLTLAPLVQCSQVFRGGRPAIDWFVNHLGNLGMECMLMVAGQPCEAILHVEISSESSDQGVPRLHYQYIGS
ncbi:hypothetical protein [Janthinobacterium aquaticum]|uniref:hypothetical protein n=1 Tax=Janthinobacterium sp. FT58W TaxID=2654254 RepID=UPI001264883D|nr:hypothetical protein [Janthinobacterium sp. FT58W]KAB8038214.1 hypothetical protein GCM43_23085 [Janthinobacterium sp. FT58W]